MAALLRVGDTLALRLTAAIVAAMLVGAGLDFVFGRIAGSWAQRPFEQSGLPQASAEIVHILEVTEPSARPSLAAAASTTAFRVDWYPHQPLRPPALAAVLRSSRGWPHQDALARLGLPSRALVFRANDAAASEPGLHVRARTMPHAHFLLMQLRDGSWAGFTAYQREWGADARIQAVLLVILLLISALGVALIQARILAGPIQGFTRGIRRFGTDLRAAPVREIGPAELKNAIAAVNAMQVRIQGFVDERALLFATISHDLRTPLTRIRLRVERLSGPVRSDLLRNADEMAGMIETALAAYGDKTPDGEAPTLTDVAALVQLIADDWADQGVTVPVHNEGGGLVTAIVRPQALRRALDNIVDNAIRYAGQAEIRLCVEGPLVRIEVRDRGPGLPQAALERMFMPFQRLDDQGANPKGLGLGLASARQILRAHGGDVFANNRTGGGLSVTLCLPAAA